MITPDRVERLLDNEQIDFTRTSTAEGEHWKLRIPGLPKTLTLSPSGEHLIIRTGRMPRGTVRPGDQPLLARWSEAETPSLQGTVDDQRRYVVDLHLPGKKGLSQRRFFRSLLEASSTYLHVMRATKKAIASAAR